jgi:O-antigen ligase
MLDKGIYAHNRELGRFGSLFLNPNYLGAFVNLVFPGVFVWALNEERLKMRLYAVIALLALVFSLVETQSRAPLIAFGIGTLLLMVGPCGHVTRTRRIGFLAAFVVVLAIVLPGFYTRAIGRFDEIEVETSRDNALSRQTTWEYSLRIIAEHPLTGIGFGEPQFMRAMNEAGFGTEFGIQSLDAPHNSYIQAAVYAGLPALALFLLANGLLLGKAVFYVSRAGARDPATIFGLFVGIAGFLMSIFPDIQLFTPNLGAVYWVLFGILLTLLTNAPERLASVASASVAAAPATMRPIMWQPQVPERSSRVSAAYLAALEARRRDRQ